MKESFRRNVEHMRKLANNGEGILKGMAEALGEEVRAKDKQSLMGLSMWPGAPTFGIHSFIGE